MGSYTLASLPNYSGVHVHALEVCDRERDLRRYVIIETHGWRTARKLTLSSPYMHTSTGHAEMAVSVALAWYEESKNRRFGASGTEYML